LLPFLTSTVEFRCSIVDRNLSCEPQSNSHILPRDVLRSICEWHIRERYSNGWHIGTPHFNGMKFAAAATPTSAKCRLRYVSGGCIPGYRGKVSGSASYKQVPPAVSLCSKTCMCSKEIVLFQSYGCRRCRREILSKMFRGRVVLGRYMLH
jgi:hypothetical protein